MWTGLLTEVGLVGPGARGPDSVDANRVIVRDTPRLAAALREVVADDARRRRLQDEIALLAAETDEVIGRWAGVMLTTDAYAEVIDRHVELAGDISWLTGVFDSSDPPADLRRRIRANSSPAAQVDSGIARSELADRIVVIAQLAEELDRSTLELALRIVPVEWWRERLGAADPR